jgi:outer membrane protein assembly factor BamE (lipoprotein component of BamABCDE complex)
MMKPGANTAPPRRRSHNARHISMLKLPPPVLLAVLLAAFTTGCVSLESGGYDSFDQPRRELLRSAAERFASVNSDMTREQIQAILGRPQKEDGRKLKWEVRADAKNVESLFVEFDSAGKVVTLTRDSARHSKKAAVSLGG